MVRALEQERWRNGKFWSSARANRLWLLGFVGAGKRGTRPPRESIEIKNRGGGL